MTTCQEFPTDGSCQNSRSRDNLPLSSGTKLRSAPRFLRARARRGEPGMFQTGTPGSVILSPSPCCDFLFLQVHDGSMQKNFCLPLFIWELKFSRLRSARESARRSFASTGACAVAKQAQPWERGRSARGAGLVYISADSLLSLFRIPLIAWQEKYREDTAIWLTVLGAGGGWQGKGAQCGSQPSSSKKQNIWLPLVSRGKLSYKNL